MTSREQLLFNILQDNRHAFLRIQKGNVDNVKKYAASQAKRIKNLTFGIAYGATPQTLRKKLDEAVL